MRCLTSLDVQGTNLVVMISSMYSTYTQKVQLIIQLCLLKTVILPTTGDTVGDIHLDLTILIVDSFKTHQLPAITLNYIFIQQIL